MVLKEQAYTVEQFDVFAAQPENSERLLEFIGGEIFEVPSNPFSSYISAIILSAILSFVRKNSLGFVTGEAGGYRVSGERYAPDVAFVSKVRQPELAKTGYNPVPPDLAVEVISPTDTDAKLRIKLGNYLAAGTVVWIVYPEKKTIEVYTPGQPVQILNTHDTLSGGEVLPGFELPVNEIFAE